MYLNTFRYVGKLQFHRIPFDIMVVTWIAYQFGFDYMCCALCAVCFVHISQSMMFPRVPFSRSRTIWYVIYSQNSIKSISIIWFHFAQIIIRFYYKEDHRSDVHFKWAGKHSNGLSKMLDKRNWWFERSCFVQMNINHFRFDTISTWNSLLWCNQFQVVGIHERFHLISNLLRKKISNRLPFFVLYMLNGTFTAHCTLCTFFFVFRIRFCWFFENQFAYQFV